MFIIASKISLYPKEHYDNGLAIVTVPTRRISPAALPPTIKSLNYLNNILGKIEAKQFGALEAIMLNDQGYVAECTADNIFIVHKGEIITPAASQGALKGITRSTIFDIAQELGLPIREADMTRYDVWVRRRVFPHRLRRGGHPGGEARRPRNRHRQARPDHAARAGGVPPPGAGRGHADLRRSRPPARPGRRRPARDILAVNNPLLPDGPTQRDVNLRDLRLPARATVA